MSTRRCTFTAACAALAAACGVCAWMDAAQPRPAGLAPPAPARTIRYDRDVRPILSDRCFLCHGPDAGHRKADLRLDLPDAATAPRKDGAAIVPGDPMASQAWKRAASDALDVMMPPPESGKHSLTGPEREILRAWIEQGAHYEPHWAFVPPTLPSIPAPVDARGWCRTEVDRFVLQAQQERGIGPSSPADTATLARRVFLDVTGLPPTPEELAAFAADTRTDAYERLVETLLTAEPYRTRYAERMATPWMDLARYADTSGIHMDAGRQAWAWRDWVLNALRTNMPYDQFVVEQLAGDLLPDATPQQRVATGFNRNHVTSDEGGALDDEYLLEYAVDRTNTTGSVFLGLSVGCARCHDHKFDPIGTRDYYSLLAFFNSNEEPGIYSQTQDANRAHEPFIDVPSPDQRAALAALDAQLAARTAERASPSSADAKAQEAFVGALRSQGAETWAVAKPIAAASASGATLVPQADGSVLASGATPKDDTHLLTVRVTGTEQRLILLEMMADPSLPGGRTGRAFNGNAALNSVELEAISAKDPTVRVPVELTWAWADVEQGNEDLRAVNVLNTNPAKSWAPDSHNQPGGRTLLLCAAKPFGYEGGTDLAVRLRYDTQYAEHAFGRVRVQTARAQPELLGQLPEAAGGWHIAGPFATASGDEAYGTSFGPEAAVRLDPAAKFGGQAWRFAPGVLENQPVSLAQGVGAEFVAREIWSPDERDLDLSLGSDDGIVAYLNGAQVLEHKVDRGVAPDQERLTVHLKPGRNMLVCKVVNTGGPGAFFHRAEKSDRLLGHDAVALALPVGAPSPASAARAADAWRAAHSPAYRVLTAEISTLQAQRTQTAARIPRAMVMKDRAAPAPTYVMTRGQYNKPDKSQPVERGVPAALGSLAAATPADGAHAAAPAPRTRLDLARWLVSPQNPLTARVTVNRMWELLFGRGLVRTSDDFGLQGEWPSHPELLDWLAVDFQQHGWDCQRTLRQILLSATYRQASRVRQDAAAVDPENRLLSYFPRQRLSAEQVRDQALYVGGLLVEHLGGPSVKPYQPEGLWQEVAMPQSNTRVYMQGKDQELWRRSLYTYWKRAAPPPSMLALDAPTREFCTTRRLATDTPLQALVLWNDPQFVEAARAAAARTLREPGSDAEHLRSLFVRCTGAPPDAAVDAAALRSLQSLRARYATAPEEAATLIAVGESPAPAELPAAELAAWTLVANSVLASDASIVKD